MSITRINPHGEREKGLHSMILIYYGIYIYIYDFNYSFAALFHAYSFIFYLKNQLKIFGCGPPSIPSPPPQVKKKESIINDNVNKYFFPFLFVGTLEDVKGCGLELLFYQGMYWKTQLFNF